MNFRDRHDPCLSIHSWPGSSQIMVTVACEHCSRLGICLTVSSQGEAVVRQDRNARALRIIDGREECKRSAVVVTVGDTAEATKARAVLTTEALALEADRGKNVYSDYLLQHRRRPPPDEAAAIGRMLGGRVEACDGSMQPALSPADKRHLRDVRSRRAASQKRYDQILTVRSAISALAHNLDDPSELIGCGSFVLDGAEIARELDSALSWLGRFAEEWHNREKTSRA